ncbi:MAG: tetratricopeptide repeat protein [Chloroflexi bacterium]|nr:tetratricopeptide repeat protein [Chloroflexota bacterium]
MRPSFSLQLTRLIAAFAMVAGVVLIAALPLKVAEAQDSQPLPPATALTADELEELRDLAALTRTNAEDAARYASDASNFLSLFEAFSVVVAIAAGSLGVVGVTRLFAAQNALNDTRKRIIDELADLRSDFEQQIEKRERDLKALEDQINQTIELQRRSSAQATLALSLMPLGERQYRAQDYSGAAETYKRALAMDQNNPLIHYRLGYVFVQNGQLPEAELHLVRALEIDPEFALARAALGYVYRRIADKQPEGLERDLWMNKGEQFFA